MLVLGRLDVTVLSILAIYQDTRTKLDRENATTDIPIPNPHHISVSLWATKYKYVHGRNYMTTEVEYPWVGRDVNGRNY